VKRSILFLVTLGGLLVAMGLVATASTIGEQDKDITRNVSLLLASFGGMVVAIPLYVDSRRIQAQFRRETTKRNLSPCAVCGQPLATLWCTTHTVRICPDCLPKHDSPNRCLYKALRRAALSANRSAASQRG
jgi:ABC-type xylose transport system permease subunit